MVWEVAFAPDGHSVLASSGSESDVASAPSLYLWDVETGEIIHDFSDIPSAVKGIAFSPAGDTLLTGLYNNDLLLWDLETYELRYTFKGHNEWVGSIAFTPDGGKALSIQRHLQCPVRSPGTGPV